MVQDLATQWINIIRVKQRLHRRRKRVCESFSSRHTSQKLFLQTIGQTLENLENLNTSSVPDKWHCWRAVRRVKEGTFSSIAAIRIGWKIVGWFNGMLLLSAKCPIPPGRWENSALKTIWRTIQRTNNSFLEQWFNIIQFQREICVNFGKKVLLGTILWLRVEFGKEIFWLRILEHLTQQKFILEKSMRKKYWWHKKRYEFTSPAADGTTKPSGRDYDFRNPTLREEPTVRREVFSGELRGESGESRPTESTDDAEARADFWSIQGDFIYRHHNERRKKTFPIPLKYIDEARRHAIKTCRWLLECQF